MSTETKSAAVRLREIETERQQLLAKQEQDRETYKELVSERVPEVVKRLIAAEQYLIEAKKDVYNSFRDIINLKSEVYGVKDVQQSHTFAFKEYSIKLGYRVNAGWDDTYKVGMAKVLRFLEEQTTPDKSHYVKAILKLLKYDKNGNLNPNRVLDLKQVADDWGNPELIDGVNIILKAHRPKKSNWFIEARQPDEVLGSRAVGLSISSVDFPSDFDFGFVNEIPSENAND